MKMTIDEAIAHCLEVAEENEELSSKFDEWDEWEKADANNCRECAADHRQLAEWLTKLKELEAKHWDECRQIAHYDDEIKRLEATAVQPVKHGRWEYYKNNGIFDTHKCTLCGEKYEMYMDIEPTTIYKYCPNCGADMRGDTD
jgi:hypothetical protein